MRKWTVIGFSIAAIAVWVAFFIVLVGKEVPDITARQHAVATREVNVLNDQSKRFEPVEENESTDESQNNQQPEDTSSNQDKLHEFEKGNAISIDELLAALNIGYE